MLLTIALLFVTTECIAQKAKQHGVVNIKDARKTPRPDGDVAHHKYHDVEVYRTMDNGNSYTVYFYSNFNDSLFRYQTSWGANDDMDKAAYKWIDDTLASIRLFNSHTKKEVNFKVWERGLGILKQQV